VSAGAGIGRSSDRTKKGHREVDSPDWEHRRGEEPYGRMNGTEARRSQPGGGEGRGRGRGPRGCVKGQEWYPSRPGNGKVASRRKTPGSMPQGTKDEGGAGKPDERLRRMVRR
jgi:hypothetical protein